MSIPPLVCTTPPPPDQCEDDKDHDDYELQDNLSQEDDENNDIDFGNYPSYNHFETYSFKQSDIPTSYLKHGEGPDIPTEKIVSSEKETEEIGGALRTKDTNEIKFGIDDDFDIEDLDLKLDSESSSSSVKDNSSSDEISKHETSMVVNCLDDLHNKSNETQVENSCVPSAIETVSGKFEELEDETTKFESFEKDNSLDKSQEVTDHVNTTSQKSIDEIVENEIIKEDPTKPSNVLAEASNDDFGDFDEFQFNAPGGKSNTGLDSCDNPWDDNTTQNTDFSSFTANFDNEINYQSDLRREGPNENSSEQKSQDLHNEDDSFGDFDDFQSVTQGEQKISSEIEICSAVPVLNLQSTENEAQIMESINKVLYSLFEEEIVEPVNEDELKLESLLSETWGHLTETDVRQPYIINWNSSLGQKTLLKALCIDSRNILFGPKWSHSMPKYAANLSSAPLQPQKQPSNIPQNEAPSTEKATSKANWSDPFSADGQQSCNTENENNVEPRPTDLDVFEATLSTKSDKIYSSTINVPPIRQINLPDTHIFTPTDSETPRSKTIHYDTVPAVLLPQDITDKQENQAQIVTSHSLCNKPSKEDDEDDYWEFQEFKTTPKTNISTEIKIQSGQSVEKDNEIITTNNSLPKASIIYQTQLLQPIKIEPVVPTLNWPNPGEVKEKFDAFSDFTASSWVDSNSTNSQIESAPATNRNKHTFENNNEHENIPEKETINSIDEHNFEDDFDTFQSALPHLHKTMDFKSDSLNMEPSNNFLADKASQLDNENSILKDSSVKTDTISLENTVKLNENLQHTLGFVMNNTETTNRNPPSMGPQLHMNLLQPMPVGSAVAMITNQQKSGQILQPLSLESYSQINWPSPGIDLQDLSRFNPVETLHSLKSDLSVSGQSKSSPIHNNKPTINTQGQEDDVWGEFVSSKPTPQISQTKKQTAFGDDDEWTDFVSSPSVKPHNGLNTISLNVHTNSNMQKTNQKFAIKNNQISLDIPTLNYITPKTSNHKSYNDRHFQNL